MNLSLFPVDILEFIVGRLNLYDFITLSSCCKHFRKLWERMNIWIDIFKRDLNYIPPTILINKNLKDLRNFITVHYKYGTDVQIYTEWPLFIPWNNIVAVNISINLFIIVTKDKYSKSPLCKYHSSLIENNIINQYINIGRNNNNEAISYRIQYKKNDDYINIRDPNIWFKMKKTVNLIKDVIGTYISVGDIKLTCDINTIYLPNCIILSELYWHQTTNYDEKTHKPLKIKLVKAADIGSSITNIRINIINGNTPQTKSLIFLMGNSIVTFSKETPCKTLNIKYSSKDFNYDLHEMLLLLQIN